MKPICLFSVLALCAGQAFAQTANPITTSEKGAYHLVMGNVMKAADQMPEANYSYKPTADVRSFGALIGHIADGQYEFCGPVVGDGNKGPDVEKTKTSKADLMQALKDASAYCDKAYAEMTDVKGAEMTKFFSFNMAKISLLSFNTAHTDEHYGNIVTYMRMKGMTPPSSQR